MGKQFDDDRSGWTFPVRTHMIVQDGKRISKEWRDGSRDRPDNY